MSPIISPLETIMAFAWEPIGTKFAYIHGDNQKVSVSFCDVKEGKIDVISKFCVLVLHDYFIILHNNSSIITIRLCYFWLLKCIHV